MKSADDRPSFSDPLDMIIAIGLTNRKIKEMLVLLNDAADALKSNKLHVVKDHLERIQMRSESITKLIQGIDE